LDICKNTEEE